MERPYGMVLCVGPTGSGKTTTLHSALSHINVPERKIWTAEDPVEITQPGLRQVQVNPKIDWTFAKALRAFLRADPDVIMVGEMRDEETAQMAIEASLTGHLVLSTLHTNSAPETVTRLLDMGMDPFNFADSLLGVLAQRLVRRLCNHCRQLAPLPRTRSTSCSTTTCTCSRRRAPRLRPRQGACGLGRTHGREGRLMMFHSPGCDAMRPHRPQGPRRPARTDGRLARTAPPDPDRRARRELQHAAQTKACARCARTASRRCCRASLTTSGRGTAEVRATSKSADGAS
jgi:type II secretory ATPase GspE/PulE/Tfp pilus assembly ATPase PilB-like protein